MNEDGRAVIRATYSDWRPVKSRKVLQLILEVPIEQTEEVMRALGVPRPDLESWVAVAPLHPEAIEDKSKERRKWEDMSPSQQAGILCQSSDFMKWCDRYSTEECAEYIRKICGVESRAELSTNADAASKWDDVVSAFRSGARL